MSPMLDDLDPEQRAAALAVTGPVCIVAGAGTGKTRTVTYRLAQGVRSGAVDPQRALAITHSRKAAAELGERLLGLGVGAVEARTFHAAGLWIAGSYWNRTGRGEPRPSVVSDRDAWRLWRDSLRAVSGHEPTGGMVRDLIEEVSWARSRLIRPEDYPAAAQRADRDPGVDSLEVVRSWNRYTDTKARLGRVDFADLLEIAAELVETDPTVAEAVRHRWAHVTVDEYQDTDPAQQRLLDAIVGGGQDICVVGDPRQAIYSWKGADPAYLTGFPRRYPQATIVTLTRNYRSSPQILAWANQLARRAAAEPLMATRPVGPDPRVSKLDDESAEAKWVADAARRAITAGTPVSEIAILYRFNATQARFEAALTRAGIATVVADDTTFFDREEIRAVLRPFGQAARAQPDRDGLDLLVATLTSAGFDRDDPPAGLGAARTRWESQQALLELVEASGRARRPDATALLAEINALAVRTHGPRTDGVTLATLHKAKGLEWDLVFLVGMADGAMPSAYATTPDQRAEEERLLHVGVTRARRQLHLTWPTSNARGWTNRPSPYLDLLSNSDNSRRRPDRRTKRAGKAPRTATGARAGPFPNDSHRSGGTPSMSGATCPHCTEPLKGISARRLGVCPHCVLFAPGEVGRRARSLATVISEAAKDLGIPDEQAVTPTGMVRLLDHRPATAADVAATAGVSLPDQWAEAAAVVLRP